MIPSEHDAVIRDMVERIVSDFHPESVILFGSHARSEAGRDSDVDLAVIFPALEGRRHDMAVKIRVALQGMGVPKDIVVLTRRDFEEQKDFVGTIGNILASEGRTLYRS